MKKHLNVLISFLPWLGFSLLSSVLPALALPFAIFVSLLSYRQLLKGFIVDWASLIFFIVMYANSLFFPNTWLLQHMSIINSFFFVAMAWFSLVIKKPFTSQYAKLEVEKDKWNSPHFIRINQLMTGGFGVIFLCMSLLALYRSYHPDFLNSWIIWIVGLSIQSIFIDKFPKWYRKKYLNESQT